MYTVYVAHLRKKGVKITKRCNCLVTARRPTIHQAHGKQNGKMEIYCLVRRPADGTFI